jgi:hypothetical protein
MTRVPRLVLLLVLLLLPATWSQARVLGVPADHPTIQAAFIASVSGDTIHVAPGIYYEHLETPVHSVTMLSDYAWSGDSLDIERTIIDGSWTGTVLYVAAWLQGHFRMEGFTLQRGMTGTYRAGGIHFHSRVNATLRHLVLREHRASTPFYLVMGADRENGYHGRLIMEDLRIEVDSLTGSTPNELTHVGIGGLRYCYVRKLRFGQVPHPGLTFNLGADSINMVDVLVDRSEFYEIPATRQIYLECDRLIEVDSMTFQHGTWGVDPTILSVSGGVSNSIFIKNLLMQDVHLRQPEHDYRKRVGPVSINGEHVVIENWIQRNCTVNVGSVLGYVGGSSGVISNLLAENLLAGLPLSDEADCERGCTGGGLLIYNIGLDNVTIRNVTLNPFDTRHPEEATTSTPILQIYVYDNCTMDTLTFRNVEVSHVVVNDPDDYSRPETDCMASEGRAFDLIFGDATRPFTIIMDSCRFVENRQPNTQPERMPTNPLSGNRMVGSTVQLDGFPLLDTRLYIRNTALMHNDDGGLDALNFQHVEVDNVTLIDNSRMGVKLGSMDSTIVNNIFVSQTNSYLAELTYPYSIDFPSYQYVASIFGANQIEINNATYSDNNTEFLFKCQREDFQDTTFYRNSIFSRNTYDFFTNPWHNQALFPPPSFENCFLPIEQPGFGNIIGQDVGFDWLLGPPFLAANSPCIDAGDPNPAFNDIEDPLDPGFPLWPALGTLRNDMGFTGGPHAVPLDTSWVSVPMWQPSHLPRDFALGAPFPNPFNPTVRIPFTLTRPEIVRLSVHNLMGQKVAVLVNGVQFAGRHDVRWDAGSLASGVYVVRLEAGGRTESRAVTLLR